MIVLNNDSIIQISTTHYGIIISIFQFLENNNKLFVKIYNLDRMTNAGYNYFSNPRLSIFKNSVLVGFSTLDKNNIDRTGYFVVDYPNSFDGNFTSNVIKIKDLISLPNKLFLLDLKLRVLKIPKDYIFLNKKNNLEIEENKDYELADEFILRQYRIKEGVSFIKFKGVAIGNDKSYSNWRIYPEIYPDYREKPEPTNIIIEGEEGNIYINFSDCLQGYYHLDYDYNLCTNLKRDGYYLDNETNTYRTCNKNCSECYGPPINKTHMNCINYKTGYNMTEDTNSCYDYYQLNII